MALGVSKEELSRLSKTLPKYGKGKDIDEQMASVLSLVVYKALRVDADGVLAEFFDVWRCPNCGSPNSSSRTPYCSETCKGTASFVRRFRSAVADETVYGREKQIDLGQALWNLQGGGFPRRQAMVPERVIDKVIERDGGKCSICGAPATEIDHTGSG